MKTSIALLALAAFSLPAAAQITVAPKPALEMPAYFIYGTSGTAPIQAFIINRPYCGAKVTVTQSGSRTPVHQVISQGPGTTNSLLLDFLVKQPGLYLVQALPFHRSQDGSCLSSLSTTPLSLAPIKVIPHDAFTVSVRKTSEVAPSTVIFTAVPKDAATAALLAGATYRWTLDGSTLSSTLRSPSFSFRSYIGSSTPGSVQATLLGPEGIGSESIEFISRTAEFTVAPPPPISFTATLKPVGRWTHAPATILVSPKVLGLVPGERIVQSSINLNDAQAAATTRALAIKVEAPGRHVISGNILTDKGRTAQFTQDVVVPEPDYPTCSLSMSASPIATSTSGPVYSFQATANSTTGYIARYNWFFQGKPVAGTTSKMAFRINSSTSTSSVGGVYVQAVTDAGLTCIAYPS